MTSVDGLYSTNYINILSSNPPVVTKNVTSDSCKEQCNVIGNCSGFVLNQKDFYTCPSNSKNYDLSMCIHSTEPTDNATSVFGDCSLIISDSKTFTSPVFFKNQCKGYEAICTNVWYTHWVMFSTIISVFTIFSILLFQKCRSINIKYYRISQAKIILLGCSAFTILCLIIYGLAGGR
jgi:hypothetical protein